MHESLFGKTAVKGRIRFFTVLPEIPAGNRKWCRTTKIDNHVLPGAWILQTDYRRNTVMYDWATIVGKLLQTGDPAYRISGMYLEYQNVANAEDPVTPPVYGRDDGISYYNSLSGSPDLDYIRVPLVATTLSSTDETNFPGGNLLTFFAQSQVATLTGVHGKPFNDAAISKVFGGALVAIPDKDDRTKDLIFSRFYVEVGEQQEKLSTSQIGIEWQIELQ